MLMVGYNAEGLNMLYLTIGMLYQTICFPICSSLNYSEAVAMLCPGCPYVFGRVLRKHCCTSRAVDGNGLPTLTW